MLTHLIRKQQTAKISEPGSFKACRETMVQIDPRNLDCRVVLDEGQVVLLRELLPHHWLSKR